MIVSVKASDLEVGMFTEYGFVTELVSVDENGVVVNIADDLVGYDSSDTDTYEQFEFESNTMLSYAVEDE